MPSLFLADMVRELSSSTGTGAFDLDGAAPGHRAFTAAVPANAPFPYAICGVSDESQWETGEGTLSATGQLIRSPKDSSAGGALVNFGAGLKTVALSVGADWYAARDAIDGHNHAITAVTGLAAQLADKASLAAALPTTNYVQSTDKMSVMRGNDQLAATGTSIVGRHAAGGPFVASDRLIGGFGATSTSGVTDWNDVSNAVSGSGQTLLSGAAANGPPTGDYWHPFSFEYNSKNGTGNMTQFAIPYYEYSGYFGMRFRYDGMWSTWRNILLENAWGQYAPAVDNAKTLGSSIARFAAVYAGSGSINTSDERQKADIGPSPDAWLDAWGDVEWCRFRFKDGKRWHVGLIAQRVHAAFAARGLDAFEIGLCCFDAWPEQRGPMFDANGDVTHNEQVVREAGDIWGLRYDECLAMEAAWVRRELSRLQAGKSDKRSRKNDA